MSLAELEAQGFELVEMIRVSDAKRLREGRAVAKSAQKTDFEQNRLALVEGPEIGIERLGGTMKLAVPLGQSPEELLVNLPEGKVTFGISDYTPGANARTVAAEGLRLKRKLVKQGRSVRIVENKTGILSSATVLHNGMSGKNPRKVELMRVGDDWYRVVGVQDIDAYARRDQARPARDAKVGMLPPKLAQILINLCGPLPEGSRILDPFCGTGVLLQEAMLMGYKPYGTDISERMVKYTEKNMDWLLKKRDGEYEVAVGDATSCKWNSSINAVACEAYLGKPFSTVPTEIEVKEQKQECNTIILGFLRNLAQQIETGTPVVVAMPAWLRPNGEYQRLENLDEIQDLGYNVVDKLREGLFYVRDGQIVARDIIRLRKK